VEYLILLAVLLAVGGAFLALRERRPQRRSMETSIDDFNRRMRALAPRRDPGA
jgi:hypothetical protein